jgi:hypothetical protein
MSDRVVIENVTVVVAGLEDKDPDPVGVVRRVDAFRNLQNVLKKI